MAVWLTAWLTDSELNHWLIDSFSTVLTVCNCLNSLFRPLICLEALIYKIDEPGRGWILFGALISNIPPSNCCTYRHILASKILLEKKVKVSKSRFSPTWPHWAELVIESPCPCVWMFVLSGAVFSEASHWPWDHMISSRPLIGPPSLPPLETWKLGNSETR